MIKYEPGLRLFFIGSLFFLNLDAQNWYTNVKIDLE